MGFYATLHTAWPAVPSTTASPPPPPPPPQPLLPISTPVSLASDLPPSAIGEPTSAGEDKKLSLSDSLAAAAIAAAGKSGLAILEPENKLCFVCNQIGSTDSLSACIDCCNIYHLSCHSGDDEELPGKTELASNEDEQNGSTEEDGNVSPVQILPQRDNLCPVCLAAARRPKPASTPVL